MITKSSNFETVADAITWTVVNSGQRTALIQIFGTCTKNEAAEFGREIKSHNSAWTIVGVSSHNSFVNENIVHGRIVVSIVSFENPTTIRSTRIAGISEDTKQCYEQFNNFCSDEDSAYISFASGIKANEDSIFDYFRDHKSAPLIGGIADFSKEAKGPWVLLDDQCTSDGLVIVSLRSNNLRVQSRGLISWVPVGKIHTVSKANGQVISEFNGETALKFYQSHLNSENDFDFNTFQNFPIHFKKGGDFFVSAPIELMPDGSMLFTKEVEAGTDIRLSYCHPDLTPTHIIDELKTIDKFQPELILMYNCFSRLMLGGESAPKELGLFSTIAPTAGTYLFGEFGVTTQQHVIDHSLTYLALSENPINRKTEEAIGESQFENDGSLLPIFSLIKKATEDLMASEFYLKSEIDRQASILISRESVDEVSGMLNRFQLTRDFNSSTVHDQRRSLLSVKVEYLEEIRNLYGDDLANAIILKLSLKLRLLSWTEFSLKTPVYKVSHEEWVIVDVQDNSELILNVLTALQSSENSSDFRPTEFLIYGGYKKLENSLSNLALDEFLELARLNRRAAKSKNIQLGSENEHVRIKPKVSFKAFTMARKVIRNSGITPFAQPIFSLTDSSTSFEMLFRASVNDRLIMPGELLPHIEDTYLYPEISRQMIQHSALIADKLGIQYSINVAPQDLLNPESLASLRKTIESLKNPNRMAIEILETEQILNISDVKTILNEIRTLGLSIYIDDFGSGFSNLDAVIDIQPDTLKIDGSLIKDIDKSPSHRKTVSSIVSLCHSMDIKTTAEYVHSVDVLKTVADLGVDNAQGFALSPPLDIKSLENKLKNGELQSTISRVIHSS